MDLDLTRESEPVTAPPQDSRIDDLVGGWHRLDFSRPFLPEAIAGVAGLSFLTADERRTLNQIRGNGYLSLIGLVEEHLLPYLLDRTWLLRGVQPGRSVPRDRSNPDDADHARMFRRFRAAFQAGFPHRCEVTRDPALIARDILTCTPLAVVLTILHIEWMTQRHYVDTLRNTGPLDPCFERLLSHRWLAVVRHARLDRLLGEARAATPNAEGVARSISEYLSVAHTINRNLARQVELDQASLARATGRELSLEEQATFRRVQHRSQRWTFIGAGMTHPRFTAVLADLGADEKCRVARAAVLYC